MQKIKNELRKLMQKLRIFQHRFALFYSYWRIGHAEFSLSYWAWLRDFDVSCRQIDPAVDYNMTEEKDIARLVYPLYLNKFTPDEAIYCLLRRGHPLGASRGHPMDRTCSGSMVVKTTLPEEFFYNHSERKISQAYAIQEATTKQNAIVAVGRAGNEQVERVALKNKPLAIGLRVKLKKTGMTGVIMFYFRSKAALDERYMYEIMLDNGEKVNCRAIDLLWHQPKKKKRRKK